MIRSSTRKTGKTFGFTLIELMIVISIILILLAAALIQIKSVLRASRSDAAVSYTLNQIRLARERAIDERRLYRVTFNAPQTIVMEYQFTSPLGAKSFLSAGIPLTLPYDMQFAVPSKPAATPPDNIGTQSSAIDLYCNGGACGNAVYFNPDGSATNNTNDPLQGVVYMARTGDVNSSRAVSLFGPTGKAKPWRIAQIAGGKTQWISQ